MKIEIWSDVMCPFCYIGKQAFEKALDKLPQKDRVEVVWKSYQLQPDAVYEAGKDVITQDAQLKGMPREQLAVMARQIEVQAQQSGIGIDFANVKKANTFDAHRLIHLAGEYQLAGKAEEVLFKAYFDEGKLISDHQVLLDLAESIGLDRKEAELVLRSGAYSAEVRHDIQEAAELGVSGVPFFVFNRKYAISGAQAESAFVQSLQSSFTEWEKANPAEKMQVIKGESCSPDGNCH
jgi:protein disulfide-isomerase